MDESVIRHRDIAALLASLDGDDEVPDWLVSALRLANDRADVLVLSTERPIEVPRFHYPH